jgi:hypothetical protein
MILSDVTPLTRQQSAVQLIGVVTVIINTQFHSSPSVSGGPLEHYWCNGVEDTMKIVF